MLAGCSVRPKFGIGRKYRPKLWVSVSVSEPKPSQPKPKLHYMYCTFLEFVHFNGFNRVANKKKEERGKKVGREKKVSTCKKEFKKAIVYKCM